MIILPKFLYLFQHVPFCINKSFFTNLDQQLNGFLLSNKPARIRKSVLQLPKSEGGLALPNFRYYFWACNITKFLYWVCLRCCASSPPWLDIEISSSHSLLSNICSQLPLEVISFEYQHSWDLVKFWGYLIEMCRERDAYARKACSFFFLFFFFSL